MNYRYLLHLCMVCTLLLIASSVTVLAQDAAGSADAPPTPAPVPRPAVVETQTRAGITLDRYFGSIPQGGIGVLHLQADADTEITDAQLLFRGAMVPFERGADGFYALLVADIDSQARQYPYSVLVQSASDEIITIEGLVSVESAQFIRQVFEVPPTIGYLIEPAVERQEFARIDALTATISEEPAWADDGWQLPLNTRFTSGFGQYRILNNAVQTRHTGLDQSAMVGTPVAAMAAGQVAFAGQLDIRGNYILIDHGWGIYSGYAHLSQMNVERGQTIEKGQFIGATGNTGRSQGPHLHWEIIVHGNWVDGEYMLGMWLPE